MLLKSTVRTILKSMGRFLAIMSIIALGVGFFSGLSVTEESMVKTAGEYISELGLYDYRLLSTLGFTDEDVKSVAGLSGVKAAYGSVSAEFLASDPLGSSPVLHSHTILDGTNGLDLVSGRLPEAPNECVIDSLYAGDDAIGGVIALSEENSEDTLELFAYDEYVIVGRVNASEYLNYERGSTSIGSGSVSGFIYLPIEGYSVDYYTEIYLSLDISADIYSLEYENAVDSLREELEELTEELADRRYTGLLEDGRREIADAEQELSDGESELESAKAELSDARSEYESARLEALSELEEAKTELESARAELDEGWEELSRLENDPIGELEEVSRAISEARAELEDGERSYSQGLLDYEEAQKRVDDELSSAEMELSDAERELESASAELIDAKEKIASANEELSELEEPSVFVLDRSANIGYASLENDTAVVSGVAKVFPAFFFLVAMLVCITTMTRMVSEKRTENGILKALGYSGGAIAAQFLIYAGSASAVGCIAGFMIGSRFLPMTIWEVYRIMYLVNRPAEYVLDWGLFGICTSLYLVLALGATWLVCRRDLNENAASLMRPKAPVAGKRTIIERIGFIWKRLKFLHKISIRNILRYKKRMLMMIIGIGGCTALLIAGFGIRDSVQPIVDYQFDEITLYDAQVTLLDGTDAEELTRLSVWDEVKSYSFVRSESRDLVLPGDDEPLADTDLVVFSEPLTSLVDLHSGKEAVDWPERGEAVINYRLSREYGIKAGDAILLRASDMDSIQVTVSGVYDNYMSDCIYISSETYENSCKESPEMNTAYIIFNEDSDESRAAASLLSSKQVAAVTLSSDMRTRVKNMLENLNYIVFIVLVCAGALAFIVVYNLTNITITERTREIATLKVLGFYQNEQDSYVFRENILLTGISALCGIPMGIALLNYVMAQVKISNMYFGCRLSPLSYILSIVITFLFTIIVDGVLMLRTRRINMAEAMKAIE